MILISVSEPDSGSFGKPNGKGTTVLSSALVSITPFHSLSGSLPDLRINDKIGVFPSSIFKVEWYLWKLISVYAVLL